MKSNYDKEEFEILQKYENNLLQVSKSRKQDLKTSAKSANDTIQLKAELKIKLTEKDFRHLKLKEIEIGIPSQNIITALIHKYLENKIELTL